MLLFVHVHLHLLALLPCGPGDVALFAAVPGLAHSLRTLDLSWSKGAVGRLASLAPLTALTRLVLFATQVNFVRGLARKRPPLVSYLPARSARFFSGLRALCLAIILFSCSPFARAVNLCEFEVCFFAASMRAWRPLLCQLMLLPRLLSHNAPCPPFRRSAASWLTWPRSATSPTWT